MHRLAPVLLLVAACATTPPPASGGVTTASSLQTRTEEAVERQDWAAAGTLGAELTQREPSNARAWLMLGMARLGQGKQAEAVAALERSVALKDSARARYNLGIALAQTGKVPEALSHFERAVELEPDYGLGWKSVAKGRAAVGRFPEAAQALLEARRLRPEDPEVQALAFQLAQVLEVREVPREALAHHARAGVLAEQGRDAEAEREYEAALALAPGFADCHYNLGVLARRRGDLARAEKEYRAALASYRPGEALLEADAKNNLADLLLARGGDAAEAVRLVREAIGVRGERPSFLDTLARACDAQGDRACARESFRKLLASGQRLPPGVKAHAEQRLEALGR